ncbi:MAG: MEDS domain-containing protein [Elusimicrobiota bacterium]|jgi:hypothetical protein
MEGAKAGYMTVEGLGPHDHAVLIYQSQVERLAAVVPYLKAGLERNERCLLVADPGSVEPLLAALGQSGVDAAGAVRGRKLLVLPPAEVYLNEGRFDHERVLTLYRNAVDEALAQGFSAVRATAEAAWSCGGVVAMQTLADYEAEINRLFRELPLGALCQYEYGRFAADALTKVVYTHPLVIFGGKMRWNPFYIPPEEYLRPRDPAIELTRILGTLSRTPALAERPASVPA